MVRQSVGLCVHVCVCTHVRKAAFTFMSERRKQLEEKEEARKKV